MYVAFPEILCAPSTNPTPAMQTQRACLEYHNAGTATRLGKGRGCDLYTLRGIGVKGIFFVHLTGEGNILDHLTGEGNILDHLTGEGNIL
jgi:hypothetical protein